MDLKRAITVVASALSAVASASLLSTAPLEARQNGWWGCMNGGGGPGCYATNYTSWCQLGALENRNTPDEWCNPESEAVTDCCRGGFSI
jgi:hypothetical protein